MTDWRFIPYAKYTAAENMAIDEAILDAHLEGHVPPTLRLYGWSPPAVSLGYGQKISPTMQERIRSHGYDIVRRPTGGRAVLHDFELTYSFVGSAGDKESNGDGFGFLSESVIKAYKQICEGLIETFRELDVELELGTSTNEYKNAHDCFLATTTADLHYQGKKMVGSAQLRRRHAVLQHGSILLHQPQDLMSSLLKESRPVSSENSDQDVSGEKRHANLWDVIAPLSEERWESAFLTGFQRAFGHQLVRNTLTEQELDASKVHTERYLQVS